MSLQNSFFARNQIVIFHKGSSFCVFFALCHNFHQTNHGRCFPVTFSAEAIAFFHKSLNSQTRKLLQTAQITEMCHNSLIVFLFQETFKTNFNLCLYSHMSSEFIRISAFQKNVIFIIIFFHQSIGISLRNLVYCVCNLIDRISVYFPAELNLRFYLITFCNRYISHVIRNSHNTDVAAFNHPYCGTHPGSYSLLHFFVVPEAYNHLALHSHAANNVTVFSVSVSRLVFVHEIHINGIIWNFSVKLCV